MVENKCNGWGVFYHTILEVDIRILCFHVRSSKLEIVNINEKRRVNSLFTVYECEC